MTVVRIALHAFNHVINRIMTDHLNSTIKDLNSKGEIYAYVTTNNRLLLK